MCHLSIDLVDSINTSNRVEITAFESRICPALTTISSPNAAISHVHLSLSLSLSVHLGHRTAAVDMMSLRLLKLLVYI